MDKSAIDTPSREIDLRNIPVHLRTALRRALEFEARAPAPRSAEEAEQCEEQLRAIADEFFGALLTPVLQRAVRSAAVGDAASALVRHLPRRMRSDGLETVNVRTSRGTTVPVTTPYYREKHARRAKRRPGLYPIGANLLRCMVISGSSVHAEVRGELRLSSDVAAPPARSEIAGQKLIMAPAGAAVRWRASTWLSTNLKLDRHALGLRRRRHVVAPGADRAGVVDQLLHQQRHEQFPVEPRLGAVVVVLRHGCRVR